MKKYDVTALGELLIDFTENGMSGQGNPIYEANPGGAPCNVLAMLTKLGRKTAFIGKVGHDIFGNRLKEILAETGIDISNLVMDEEARTTLAFVETFPDGDRDFSFYRNPGADMMLREEEVHKELLQDSTIFHFGTLSMTHEQVRCATKKAVETAKASGAVVSFDPNLREPLWKSLEDAKEQVAYGLSKCDFLKISDNEIQWFTGEEDFDAGIRKLKEQYDIPLIVLSMGKDGSRAYYKDLRVEAAPFLQEHTIETTGAGDTFGACCLHHILKYDLDGLDEDKLREMLTFANAAASIITTRKGAIRSMPDREEVGVLLANYGKNQEEPKAARTFDILLGSVDKVKAFVNDMSKIEGDVLLCVGKYVIDAKSIMGIFSLELSKPLRLEIENWKEEYAAILEKYLDN